MQRVKKNEMATIDTIVPEQYGITTSRMMENAGYQIADFIRQRIEKQGITVYAGKGNNGGDGLVAARRLHTWGYDVEVVLSQQNVTGIRQEEKTILENLNIKISNKTTDTDHDIAIDALLGYNIEGDPRPPIDDMIDEINRYNTIVSVDIPSGLDVGSGKQGSPIVKPDYTITLAAPFENMKGCGDIYVADISIPNKAYHDLGLQPISFEKTSSRQI